MDDPAQLSAPLFGLRVVDLSCSPASAMVTQLLADFGAHTTQVEPPGGSPLRASSAYPFWARGKQSVELDLKAESGLLAARRLIDAADIVVEAWRPGRAAALGLGHEEVAADNPGLVYASISGWGSTGPYAGVPGYEGLVMARIGGMTAFGAMAGRPGPAFPSVNYCTFSAAQTALHGILGALVEKHASGHGQHVETSLLRGIAAHDTWDWFLHVVSQRFPDALEVVPAIAADGTPTSSANFTFLVGMTADGRWLQFTQGQPHLFRALMRVLELEWMYDDPEWSSAPVFDDLDRRLAFWDHLLHGVRRYTLAEWQEIFDREPDVWAEVFRRGPELLDHPQLRHHGFVTEIVDPQRGRVRQPAALARLDRTPAVLGRPAPGLDEHDAEVAGRLAGLEPRAAAPATAPPPVSEPLLAGITVVELGLFFSGPYSATLLADLGARVIKIESLDGDGIRWAAPFPEVGAAKAVQGKQSVAVDLGSPEGRAIVHDIVRGADIVMQSFRAGVAERLQVDYESLRAVNPDLVYLSAPGYGSAGPMSRRPAFAPSIGAGAGVGYRNVGTTIPESDDLSFDEVKAYSLRHRAGASRTFAQCDGFGALASATAMLLGLVARQRGAGGQQLLTTMLSSAAHALGDVMVDYAGAPPGRTVDDQLLGLGSRYRLYEASEGWVFLACPAERDWPTFAQALTPYADLTDDERFATPAARDRHDDELADLLASTFAKRPAADWEEELLAAGVGCVEVEHRPVELALMSEEFGRASDLLVDVEHPVFGPHPRLGALVRTSRSRARLGAGCLVGQHTDVVLAELGYPPERIATLHESGVVG